LRFRVRVAEGARPSALCLLAALFIPPLFGLAPIRFRNVASAAGIDFILETNATPEKHVIETMAGGLVAFDYDGDGWTDILFTNGASIPSLVKDAPNIATASTATWAA
jgi:hypothetical protein